MFCLVCEVERKAVRASQLPVVLCLCVPGVLMTRACAEPFSSPWAPSWEDTRHTGDMPPRQVQVPESDLRAHEVLLTCSVPQVTVLIHALGMFVEFSSCPQVPESWGHCCQGMCAMLGGK